MKTDYLEEVNQTIKAKEYPADFNSAAASIELAIADARFIKCTREAHERVATKLRNAANALAEILEARAAQC